MTGENFVFWVTNNFPRRKFPPAKIFPDEVFPDKVIIIKNSLSFCVRVAFYLLAYVFSGSNRS